MPRFRGMGGGRQKVEKEDRGQAVTHGIKKKNLFLVYSKLYMLIV